MVLLEQVHHSVEVAHVLADHKGQVTGMDLLVMDNIVADLVASPLSIRGVRQNVLDSREDSHGDRVDVLERNQVSLALAADDIRIVVSEDLEAVLLQVLSVVEDGLYAGAVRLMAHIDGKSVIIVELRVLVDEKFGNELAELGDVRAEELGDTAGEPVSAEELMDAEHGAGVRKLSVEVCRELEDTSLGVGDLGDGAEGDKQGHFVTEVVGSILRECAEHLSGSLGVANVGDLLSAGLGLDCIDNGGQVVCSHFKPGEVPEFLLVMVRVILGVRTAVRVAARISEPDIIASTCGHEGWSHVRVVHDPAVGRVKDAVLEQNGRLCTVRLSFAHQAWDTEDVQLVAVLGCHLVELELETVLGANLLEGTLRVTGVTIRMDFWHGPDFVLLSKSSCSKKSNDSTESLHNYYN